jgi:DNA-binding NarL/FixJ family response regulator
VGHRVLVVDDHPVFRCGLVSLVRGLHGVTEVVEAERVEAGLAQWRKGSFALVTVDVSLPDGDGFSLLASAREEQLAGAAFVLSAYDDRAYRVRAKAEGARGYASKLVDTSALREALARCLAGDAAFQAPAASTAPRRASSEPGPTSERVHELSPTEQRIIALLSRNVTSREMALTLGVSVRTIENHRANICRKLELRGPHRLLEFALLAAPLLASASLASRSAAGK